MRALLSINNYDKDAYVDRWLRQAEALDPARWRVQVVTNGPGRRDFPVETLSAPNSSVNLGYRESLSAVGVPAVCGAVVSVHAKTWLPDLRLLDLMVGGLTYRDGVLLEWPMFREEGAPGGECLFLMAFTSRAWRTVVDRLAAEPADLQNEIAMRWAIHRAQLDVLRLPCVVKTTQDGRSHRITDISASGLMMYGCEPSTNMGFGHYLEPGGYQPVRIGPDGTLLSAGTPGSGT